jgi:predicted nucleotidyltransferase
VQTTRATKDIDFGIMVASWGEYEKLKSELIETKNFTMVGNIEHRLLENSTKTLIDLVPFGKIESPKGKIIWRSEFEMNTVGFEEAFENALNIQATDDLIIKVASPVGLALLKLAAWQDRKSGKDSEDFWLIVKNYLDLGNYDRLFTELDEMLERDDYEDIYASARLLGRDLAKIMSPAAKKFIANIFENEKLLQRLALESFLSEEKFDEDLAKFIKSLKIFWQGVNEMENG